MLFKKPSAESPTIIRGHPGGHWAEIMATMSVKIARGPPPIHDGLEISLRKQGAKSDWDKCHKPFVSEVRQMLQAFSLVSVSALCLFGSRSSSFEDLDKWGQFLGGKRRKTGHQTHFSKNIHNFETYWLCEWLFTSWYWFVGTAFHRLTWAGY